MHQNQRGLLLKVLIISVTCVFCLTITTCFALFVLLGLGAIEMSDPAVGTLGVVTIAQIKLMRVVVKLTGQILLSRR